MGGYFMYAVDDVLKIHGRSLRWLLSVLNGKYILLLFVRQLSFTVNRQLISIFINTSILQIGLNGSLPINYFISRSPHPVTEQPTCPIRHDQCGSQEDHLTRWRMAGHYRSCRWG